MKQTLSLYAAFLLGGLMLPAFSPVLAQDAEGASTIVTVEPSVAASWRSRCRRAP